MENENELFPGYESQDKTDESYVALLLITGGLLVTGGMLNTNGSVCDRRRKNFNGIVHGG